MVGNPYHDEKGKFTSGGSGRSRAAVGGEIAKSNAYFYKGGQFLPTTDLPPGSFRIGKKIIKGTGRQVIEPGKWEHAPTPLHRSIYEMIYGFAERTDKGLRIKPGILDAVGRPVSPSDKIRPDVKGFLSTEEHSLQSLYDRYNKGERWIEVKPEGYTHL